MVRTCFRVPLAAMLLSLLGTPDPAAAQLESTAGERLTHASSTVGFTIYAWALFKVKQEGRFKDFAGDVSYDPAHPADTRVDLTVYTASVDTRNAEKDDLLRSSDFFDVEHSGCCLSRRSPARSCCRRRP